LFCFACKAKKAFWTSFWWIRLNKCTRNWFELWNYDSEDDPILGLLFSLRSYLRFLCQLIKATVKLSFCASLKQVLGHSSLLFLIAAITNEWELALSMRKK
jgi:hypothetical protein